jgi:hypothetical protein
LEVERAARADPLSVGRRFHALVFGLGVAHLAAYALLGGLKLQYIVIDVLLIGLPWVGPRCLNFARAALPFWLTAVVVDGQRFLPLLGKIHTGDMWHLEMSLFPGPGGHSWAEFLNAHPHSVLDFFCGASYAIFLYEFFAVAIFLYFVRRERYAPIAWAFFAANTIGAIVYMFCPVAPPWYIIDHGLGPAIRNAPAGLGGCARFDALLHIHYFHDFYAQNPNVFGAMPSLHVCYPLLVVFFTWERGWIWRVATIAFDLLVIFSAVYLAHHWVLDVAAGLLTAVVSYYVGFAISRRGSTAPLSSPKVAADVSLV